MSIFRFRDRDLIKNSVRYYPKQKFYINDSNVYESQEFPTSSLGVTSFITKDGTLNSFKTVSISEYNTDFTYGDTITGPSITFASASIDRDYYALGGNRSRITSSLRNSLDFYKKYSPHYAYSSSLGDKSNQGISLITFPKVYYGNKIRKGSVKLQWYVTGTLIGQLEDVNLNGELVQTLPVGSSESGSVAGVCLYNEGMMLLTGSWDIGAEPYDYLDGGSAVIPAWKYFGAGIEDDFPSGQIPSASFGIEFQGENTIQVLTMMCHAKRGMLNHSNNPTYIKYGTLKEPSTSSLHYKENTEFEIKNVVQTPYADPTGSFEKITYISKVHIYDEEKNLLGVAKLATPVKKTFDRDFTFKLKLDI